MGASRKQTTITVDSRYNARAHGDCTQCIMCYIYLLYIHIVCIYIHVYVHNIPAMKTHGTQNSCNVGKSTNESLVVHVFFCTHKMCHSWRFTTDRRIKSCWNHRPVASRSIGAGHEGIAMQFASWIILVKFFLGTLW